MTEPINPAIAARRQHLPRDPVLTQTLLLGDELRAVCIPLDRLPHWIVTNNPRDFPGKWVARLAFCFDPPEITATYFVGDTREEVEACIPFIEQGRWTFLREHNPAEPQIIGVWI